MIISYSTSLFSPLAYHPTAMQIPTLSAPFKSHELKGSGKCQSANARHGTIPPTPPSLYGSASSTALSAVTQHPEKTPICKGSGRAQKNILLRRSPAQTGSLVHLMSLSYRERNIKLFSHHLVTSQLQRQHTENSFSCRNP